MSKWIGPPDARKPAVSRAIESSDERSRSCRVSRASGTELSCQRLLDPDEGHSLLVYTATPGSESHEKLQLLSVIGAQVVG